MEKKNNILERVLRLHQMFVDKKIPTLAQHEVNPGLNKTSRENYLYFTLAPCINFQRSSPAMWAGALKTYNDPETRYLFLPEEVVKRPIEEVRKDLLKHKLGLQPNKHTEIWTRISKTLHEQFADDPRQVILDGEGDVERILQLLQKEKRELFPYLSGPKMANYWLYILSQYTDVKLKNMQAISIIPDTHVLQCTIKLGLLDKGGAPEKVALVWRELLTDSPIAPVQMHPVLWNWSRNNFLPEV